MKLCKDCKWLTKSYCKAPSNGISTVTGEIATRFCGVNRKDLELIQRNSCGESAKYFEPKEIEVKSRGAISEFFSKLFKGD